MLSSIFIFYEYSKNKTRILGKNVHRDVNAKRRKKHQISSFIFKSMHESLLGAFFPHFAPNIASTPTKSRSLCSSEQSHAQKYQTLYLKSCDSDLNTAFPAWPHTLLIPQSQTIQSVSCWVSNPHHHSSQPTLPFFPQPSAVVCNRAVTVSQSSLARAPRPQSVSKNK